MSRTRYLLRTFKADRMAVTLAAGGAPLFSFRRWCGSGRLSLDGSPAARGLEAGLIGMARRSGTVVADLARQPWPGNLIVKQLRLEDLVARDWSDDRVRLARTRNAGGDDEDGHGLEAPPVL
jgi:hypothetical protein